MAARSLSDILTVGEVARLAEVSDETVRIWSDFGHYKLGKLRCERNTRGVRYYQRRDVEAFLKAREQADA